MDEMSVEPGPTANTRKAPGRVWYLVAGLLAVAGLAAAGFSLWRTLTGIEGDLIRVTFPGQEEISLAEPGTYTIFVEYQTGTTPDPESAELTVEVISEQGESLQFTRPSGTLTYTLGGRTGEGVLQFEVDQPGNFRFVGDYPDGDGPDVMLAVNRGFTGRLFTGIGAVILIPLATGSAAIAIAVVTFLRRRRALKSPAAA